MQTPFTFAADDRLNDILSRLSVRFDLKPDTSPTPLGQLIFALIAEGAAQTVSVAGYNRLRNAYPRWSDLLAESSGVMARHLLGVPQAREKAKRLSAVLRAIHANRGALELDFLSKQDAESAISWLTSLPGVSHAMAASVLAFSTMNRPALVIDKTAARPVRRLGLVPKSAPLSALPRQVAELAPPDWEASDFAKLSEGLLVLAQSTCSTDAPKCGACVLADLCDRARQPAGEVVAFPRAKRRVGAAESKRGTSLDGLLEQP